VLVEQTYGQTARPTFKNSEFLPKHCGRPEFWRRTGVQSVRFL